MMLISAAAIDGLWLGQTQARRKRILRLQTLFLCALL
jgi:hypothetical protein